MENIMRRARVDLSHIALMELLRQVAPASTTAKRMTTPTPPHVNGPQGISLQTGAAHSNTRGPPRSDKGEKASSTLTNSFSTLRSLNFRLHQKMCAIKSISPPTVVYTLTSRLGSTCLKGWPDVRQLAPACHRAILEQSVFLFCQEIIGKKCCSLNGFERQHLEK